MFQLGDIIKKSKKHYVKTGYDYYLVMNLWEEIVDKNLAQKARPFKISSEILYINVTEPIWAQQLNLLKSSIMSRINEKIGRNKLKGIHFQIGYFEQEQEAKTFKKKYIITKDDEIKIHQFIINNEINDEKLKEVYKKHFKFKKNMLIKGYRECKTCGILYIGRNDNCTRCSQIKKYDKIKRLIKNIEKTPWIKHEDAGINDEESQKDFALSRSILIREKQARLMDCTAYKKLISKREKHTLTNMAQEYVELKTGFKPFELTPEVMKNNLHPRIYKLLFDERQN